jgi:hypothetical protein
VQSSTAIQQVNGASNGAGVGAKGPEDQIPPETAEFYLDVLHELQANGVPFLVGGGFAFSHYTGIIRYTKDMDLFVRPDDAEWVVGTLQAAGHRAEMIAQHWLAKVYGDGSFIDIIFSSGNGVAVVDDVWLERAEPGTVLDVPVLLSPVEEMIWSKGFVLERERYDGADVAHLIRARGDRLDWERLFQRFDPHWQVLMSHLLLFRFIYPSERALVPRWVMRALQFRLQRELEDAPPAERLCQGTLLSSRQYLTDVEQWGFADARLADPGVQMTAADIDQLTSSIRKDEAEHAQPGAQPRRDR